MTTHTCTACGSRYEDSLYCLSCGSLQMPRKVTVVLGPLCEPLADRLTDTGETASQFIRAAIASALDVETPELREGNVATLRQFAKKKPKKRKR